MSDFGSDVVVKALGDLGVSHVALNPGATTRGLHDSLIRQDRVAPMLALDERVAVAMAHGYAKAVGRPMVALLHNLVGLLSGSIGIFNAFVDRTPILIIGGCGPASKPERRPWIDWIHSARSQGNTIRDFVKWVDEPADLEDTLDSLVRAYEIAMTPPRGPVYVGIDTSIQEGLLERGTSTYELPRRPVPISLGGGPRAQLKAVARKLEAADAPVLLTDYVGRSQRGFEALAAFVEVSGVRVVDLGGAHNFAASHPANVTSTKAKVLETADLVLAVDVANLSHALSRTEPSTRRAERIVKESAAIVEIGEGPLLDRTFMDMGQRFPVDEVIIADAAEFIEALTEEVAGSSASKTRVASVRDEAVNAVSMNGTEAEDRVGLLASTILSTVYEALDAVPWVVGNSGVRRGLLKDWPVDGFGGHMGKSGGAGLGYGIGASLGVAASVDPGTVVVNLQSDGDMFYTASGLWTAAHYNLPVLFVVLNNQTYGQDRMHQRQIAEVRGRSVPAGPYHGIDITEPSIDIAGLARAFGIEAFEMVRTRQELTAALRKAVGAVVGGRPCLVDVLYAE